MRVIRKQLVRRTLDMIKEIAERPKPEGDDKRCARLSTAVSIPVGHRDRPSHLVVPLDFSRCRFYGSRELRQQLCARGAWASGS